MPLKYGYGSKFLKFLKFLELSSSNKKYILKLKKMKKACTETRNMAEVIYYWRFKNHQEILFESWETTFSLIKLILYTIVLIKYF